MSTALLPSAGDAPGLTAAAPDGILEAVRLTKTFDGRKVLNEVSIVVHPGEAVGLLGPNGAGKTTTFYIVTGLMRPDRGQVRLDGTDITALPMHRRARLGLGYLPQEASVFRGLTVEDNLRAVAELVASRGDRVQEIVEQLLVDFALVELRRVVAARLSGGERRRVEIARALATAPRFLLLDEPLAGIDPIQVNELRRLIAHLKDRGLGVLITDHNVRDAFEIIDRAYILHEGRVLREGSPERIIADPLVQQVYLGKNFRR